MFCFPCAIVPVVHRASVSGECQVHPKDGGVPCGSQEKVLLFLDNSFNLSGLAKRVNIYFSWFDAGNKPL